MKDKIKHIVYVSMERVKNKVLMVWENEGFFGSTTH